MRSTLVLIWLLSSVCVINATTESDSVPNDYFNLDEFVITGTRVARLLKDSPVQTRLITSKDIAKADATNIEDLLQAEMPGVEFSYAMNQQVHMNFGGFGGQSVLFLVDGERLAGETMDDIDFNRIDMNNIERIEIVRGASSALYGSNAGGGVINIITSEGNRKFGANLDFRMSKHDDRRYVVSLTTGSKIFKNSFSATASRANSYDVFSDSNPQTRVFTTVYGHKTLNIKDRLILKPLVNLKLTGRLGFYMNKLPRDILAPDLYRSYSAGLRGEWDIRESDRLEVSYSFDQFDKSQYRTITGLDIRNYSNVQNCVRVFYSHFFNEQLSLTVGTDYMRDFLLNIRLTDSERKQDNFDIFAQVDWRPAEKWEVVTALRYDYFSDGNNSHFSPKISARYSPLQNLNFRASYGMGFRAPTLKEKYYEFDMAGIWIVKGNPNLKPEQSHNINISADYTRGCYNLTATGFYNFIENKITTGVPYSLPGDEKQLYLDYINLANFHSYGGEFSVQASWNRGFGAKISYAYTREINQRDRSGNEANNQYLPARPHSLTARFDWTRDFSKSYNFYTSLSGRFLSSVSNREYKNYYNISEGTVKIDYPGYTLWKLSVVQTFRKKLKLTVAVDNIFNYRPDYYYLNAPLTDGTTLMVGLSLMI